MFGLTTEEWRNLVLSIRTHRKERRIPPTEVARLMAIALQNTTKETLSQELQLDDPTMIGRFVRLVSVPSEFHPLITWGTGKGLISLTAASEAARVQHEADLRELLNAIVSYGMSGREVKQSLQAYSDGEKPMADSIRETIAERPQVTKRFVLAGAITPELQNVLAQFDTAKRESLLARAIRAIILPSEQFTAKLGDDRFIIVTSEEGNRSLITAGERTGSDFGELIRRQLSRAIEKEPR